MKTDKGDTFEKIWKELRKDPDFKWISYTEGSSPYEDCKETCRRTYEATLKLVKDKDINFWINKSLKADKEIGRLKEDAEKYRDLCK